eukprot:1648251-Ditylum_brightwellii.AAC.1
MVTFSKPIFSNKHQSNGLQELNLIILHESPEFQELVKGKYHIYKNLQVVIVRQNITNVQGAYMITKNLLQGNVLTAFKNAEGNKRPQIKPNYAMKDVKVHMFCLQSYIMQACYMYRAMVKPYIMLICTSVACVDEINKRLPQFPPRDDRTPQKKLANNKPMDILESAMPKSWQEEIYRQHFDCLTKRHAKFINFCKNLELLDPQRPRPKREVLILWHLQLTTNKS